MSNVRRRSRTVHKNKKWTLDRLVPGVQGGPPQALRYFDLVNGEYTTVRLELARKKGAKDMRLVLRDETSHRDAASADRALVAAARGAEGPVLSGAAAADHAMAAIVDARYGCVWRDE